MSADGKLVAATGFSGPEAKDQWADPVVLDLATNARRDIRSHGARVYSVALDAGGRVLVTGGNDGIVRVGRSDGSLPHLLYGHSAPVFTVAVSPDGKWIASAAGSETRLWPMPDVHVVVEHRPATYIGMFESTKTLTPAPPRSPRASVRWAVAAPSRFPSFGKRSTIPLVLSQYLAAALRRARYEILPDDGSYYGEIQGFDGVYANARSLEDCREELREVLEEWILFRVSRNLPLPIVDGHELTIRAIA